MYSSCLFCNTHLGQNEIIDRFSVGRRLAFDPAKGRLWVVCPRCRQWNLTPLEERWEAIEDCERRFRDARRRVSTGEIGLARLPEGVELIRIGEPLLPELAAWRYGPRLHRRRLQALAVVGAAAVVGAGIIVGGVATGIITSVPFVFVWNGRRLARWIYGSRVIASIPDGTNVPLTVRYRHVEASRLIAAPAGRWKLGICHDSGMRVFHDEVALAPARHLLAGLNTFGGTKSQLNDAVDLLGGVKSAGEYFGSVATSQRSRLQFGLNELPVTVRLALEMAAHEETERRAMEGELAELAEAWRQAEEIAAIADNMFLPPSVEAFFRRLA
jgi:hypothetical protein